MAKINFRPFEIIANFIWHQRSLLIFKSNVFNLKISYLKWIKVKESFAGQSILIGIKLVHTFFIEPGWGPSFIGPPEKFAELIFRQSI